MATRFVMAGSGEEHSPPTSNDAWTRAKQQVEATRGASVNKTEEGKQEGGKSLYEHLQANKGLWTHFQQNDMY